MLNVYGRTQSISNSGNVNVIGLEGPNPKVLKAFRIEIFLTIPVMHFFPLSDIALETPWINLDTLCDKDVQHIELLVCPGLHQIYEPHRRDKAAGES